MRIMIGVEDATPEFVGVVKVMVVVVVATPHVSAPADEDFSVVLTNKDQEELIIGFDKASNKYYIDRAKAGKVDFEPGFAKIPSVT